METGWAKSRKWNCEELTVSCVKEETQWWSGGGAECFPSSESGGIAFIRRKLVLSTENRYGKLPWAGKIIQGRNSLSSKYHVTIIEETSRTILFVPLVIVEASRRRKARMVRDTWYSKERAGRDTVKSFLLRDNILNKRNWGSRSHSYFWKLQSHFKFIH